MLIDDSTKVPLEVFTGELLRYLFLFKSSVIDKVEQVQQQLGVMNKPYLAIHIRSGFFGMEQDEGAHFNSRKAFRNSTDWEKTINCSIELDDVLFGAEHPIDLATDSNLVKKLIATEYGKRIKMANLTLQHVAFTKHKPGQAIVSQARPLPRHRLVLSG